MKMGNCSMFFFFISLLLASHSYCNQIHNITASQPLAHRQTLVSPVGIFELGFFSPNGSANQYVGLWHKNLSPRKVLWVANREEPLADTDTLASLIISSNGNLELVDGQQNTVWSTNVTTNVNTSSVAAVLSDEGNFVVKDVIAAGQSIWQSFDHPGDTLLPTQLLGFDTKSGTKNVLTSWRSNKDASMGRFMVGLSAETPSQLFTWIINGSIPYYRSGPWDKSKFIGLHIMDDRYISGFSLDDSPIQGKTYFSYNFGDTLSYLYISPEGVPKLMLTPDGKNWILGSGKRNACSLYGTCGPFGTCNPSESPICKCLKGFVPKSEEAWSKGNWTGGCVRRNKLFCQRETSKSPVSSRGKKNDDGFWKMERLKVPDSHEFVASALDAKSTSDDCNLLCLSNCSCLAYAFVSRIGCLLWSKDLLDIQEFPSRGEDVYIRIARTELGKGKPVKLISGLTALASIIILFAIVIIWYRFQANRKESGQIKSTTQHSESTGTIQTSDLREYIGNHDLSELLIYDFNNISIATNNFSIANKLGQGGFGPVYKGILQDGKEIAVKRLSSSSGQGTEEFKNEMLLISNLQHKNLVRIMGCCIKDEEKLLIYEFMPNKSLDYFLFDETRRVELDWVRRFNIIQGVARGLLYLHHDSYLKVIHRDLKVSNILLDEKMNPKISDFGLARIVQGTQSLENTQKVVGTRGYMSPEYAMGGMFSEKSDVYSFGVLVLEIISSKKNTSFCVPDQEIGFLAYAWHLWNEGKGLELVDEVLADLFSSSEAMRCVHIGLLCIQDNAAERPTMSEIVLMLSTETDIPRPIMPVFTIQNSALRPQPQYGSTCTCSMNEATVTVIEGR